MSGDHDCITNHLSKVPRVDRPRACRRRGVHYADCQHPDTCRGCVPRTAVVGELCPVCWAKVHDAFDTEDRRVSRVEELITHLRSIEKAAQAVGERVDTSAVKRLVIPDSWLAADGLMDALGAPKIPSTASIDDTFRLARDAVQDWTDLESIVSTREGAKRAVVLVKRIQVALSRWPDSETDWRHVPVMLCPSCVQPTLYRKGPLEFEDEITIECAGSNLMYDQGIGYDTCEWAMDWFAFLETYSRPIEAAFNIHRKGRS